jgi:hypothetical protein
MVCNMQLRHPSGLEIDVRGTSGDEVARVAAALSEHHIPTIHSHGELHMGDKFTTNITGSTIGSAAIGAGAVATGTVTVTREQPNQLEHKRMVAESQAALVRDQDALDALDGRMFEALNQFLRIARDIQVEHKSLAEVQSQMKVTLDEIWAEQVTKGMRPQLLPKTLEIAKSIGSNPLMLEVGKKLLGV